MTEREFHDDLYTRLQGEPELGGRLERGSKLALGFLDVRHDGITAELKVERRTAVTQETAPKYIGQPTQYAAADGARLSILSILDMSRKTAPVGVPENYVFTLQPALHGLTNPEAPSLVAVGVWPRSSTRRQARRALRSTRRRQDTPDLPKRPVSDRSTGKVFTAPDGTPVPAATDELLRALTLDPARNCWPTGRRRARRNSNLPAF